MNIARWCFRHRRLVVWAWVVTIAAAGAGVGIIGSDFNGNPEAPESESRDGFTVLDDHFDGLGAGAAGSIVFQADQGVDDPQVRTAMEELFASTDEIEFVEVTSPYSPEGFGQIAEEGELAGQVAFARVEVGEEVGFTESGEIGVEILDQAEDLEDRVDGLRIEVGGEVLAGFEPPESELIGLAFAVIVLIVSFGSVLAMGLPIAVAVAGVGLGTILTNLISNVVGMPDFALQIGAMIGLGVGIDYALFIVTRFREYLHRDHDPEVATMAALDTAGRAVVFAGVTVVVSLLGLLLIGLEFVAGLGMAAAITVAATMVASTTLLPALLGFAQMKVEMTWWRGLVAAGCVSIALLGAGLGIPALLLGVPLALVVLVAGSFVPVLRREVPRRTPKPVRESGWYRWSSLIQRRPWPFAIGGTLLLVFLAVPLLGIRLGFSDEGNYPEETTTRQAYDLLSEGFGPGFNGPFLVVAEVDGPEGLVAFQQVIDAIATDPGVASVTPALPDDFEVPEAALARVVPTSAPQDEATEELINRLRGEAIPAATVEGGPDVFVTGFVPVSVDFSDFLAGRSFLFFGVVLAMSFVLLMAVFRSLLVPVKAVILNMLSIAGAYGIVVAIFQWGHFGSITGIEPAPIEPFIPMMMFAIVFGLSMDYEVFLLSRIKEEYERTGDARNSVADGLAATARVISAAAAIMVVVFGSFLLEDGRIVKVFGAGLGMAVLLDATVVRMLLVPATMELLGERNWWLPPWIDRLLPRLHVEGAPDHEAQLEAARARLAVEDGVDDGRGEPDDIREPVGVS
jgi:putative drug exporter of the RND superfamily